MPRLHVRALVLLQLGALWIWDANRVTAETTAQEPFLLYSHNGTILKGDVRRLSNDTFHQTSSLLVQSRFSDVIALEYDYASRKAIFIAKPQKKDAAYALFIAPLETDSSDLLEAVPLSDDARPYDLAWDWRNGTLYWTQGQNIHVFEPNKYTTIFVSPTRFGVLKAVAVNPKTKRVYFTTSKGLFRMRPHEWKGESVVWAPNVTSIAVDYESGDVYYYYNESTIGCFECKSTIGQSLPDFRLKSASILTFFDGILYFGSPNSVSCGGKTCDIRMSTRADVLRVVSREAQSFEKNGAFHKASRLPLSINKQTLQRRSFSLDSIVDESEKNNDGEGNDESATITLIAALTSSIAFVALVLLAALCVWRIRKRRQETAALVSKNLEEERLKTNQNVYGGAPEPVPAAKETKMERANGRVSLDNPSYEGVQSPSFFPGGRSKRGQSLNNPCYDGVDFPKRDAKDVDNPFYEEVIISKSFESSEKGETPETDANGTESPPYENAIITSQKTEEEKQCFSDVDCDDDSVYEPVEVGGSSSSA